MRFLNKCRLPGRCDNAEDPEKQQDRSYGQPRMENVDLIRQALVARGCFGLPLIDSRRTLPNAQEPVKCRCERLATNGCH